MVLTLKELKENPQCYLLQTWHCNEEGCIFIHQEGLTEIIKTLHSCTALEYLTVQHPVKREDIIIAGEQAIVCMM